MISRKVLLPVVLATAAGTPYLVLEDDWSAGAKQQISSMFSSDAESEGSSDAAQLGTTSGEFRSEFGFGARAEMPRSDIDPLLGGPPVAHLGEVLRFDISPAWVTSRWPRVTTTLSETGMEGLRVPLVTGIQPDDLAGSLTYYFDHGQQVQRLTFEGYTGDDRRLLSLITQYYGLKAEPTLHAGMYVSRWNGTPSSVLRISRAPIVTHASPRSQLQVLLELNRPSANFGLSPATLRVLAADQHGGRWQTR
jgi:hypothetical protein